jgi:two-component sensor histidine kinase
MYDDEGFLWAGTWQSGLFRIRINYLKDRIENSIEDMTPVIKNQDIRSLFKDSKGNFWIGTRYDGVIRMKKGVDRHWTLYRYNKTNGLSSNWISSLAEDKRGNIWVGTHSGLNKLVREDVGYRIFNFNRLNNFFGEIYSIYAASDDNIWCGGFSGLVRFHDDNIDTIAAPPVVITAALSGNNELNLHTIGPVLEYKARNITFEFSSPTFINESGIMYTYRLCSIADTSWSEPQNRHTISYSNLEPGEYSFEVRAYGWNNEPGEISRYAFIISPPFWKTWWFLLSVGVLLLLMILAVHQYRVQQLIKWQEARNRIATDLHDEIGSSLTNIGILSELSYKHLYQSEGVEKYLQRISEEVQDSAQAIDDIIWSVNSHNDTLENTLARMRRFTAELFDSSDTKYNLQLDEGTKIHKLNMDQRRDLFLMYKEILNNIYKHAHADEVWINVHLMNNMLRLNIRDNGKGFLVNAATHRNGLKNIYHRTSKWKGDIFLDSKEGKGTVIDIRIPLKG